MSSFLLFSCASNYIIYKKEVKDRSSSNKLPVKVISGKIKIETTAYYKFYTDKNESRHQKRQKYKDNPQVKKNLYVLNQGESFTAYLATYDRISVSIFAEGNETAIIKCGNEIQTLEPNRIQGLVIMLYSN